MLTDDIAEYIRIGDRLAKVRDAMMKQHLANELSADEIKTLCLLIELLPPAPPHD